MLSSGTWTRPIKHGFRREDNTLGGIRADARMSLKRIIQRGAGYARRRDRSRYCSASLKPLTPGQLAEMKRKEVEFTWGAFGFLFVVGLVMFGLAGLVWLVEKISYALGLDGQF